MEENDIQETRRLAQMLRLLIRISGRPLRDVERELGLGSGMLSKILLGRLRLQVSHVLMITRFLGIDPGDFFRWAYPYKGQPHELVQAAQLQMPARDRVIVRDEEAERLEEARFRDRVREVLRELLAQEK